MRTSIKQGMVVQPTEVCYQSGSAVAPNDGADLPGGATVGLYVGVTGDLTVDFVGTGTSILLKAVPVGLLPVSVKRVHATGTTATNIVALY